MSLVAICLALPMLAVAMSETDLFEVSLYGTDYLFLGLWQACGWFTSDGYECRTYATDDLNDAFNGAAVQFNALRALTVVGTALTLVTAILAAIRLARQQRNKPNSTALNTSTLLCALLAVGSTGAAFGLTFPLTAALDDVTSSMYEGMTAVTWGDSWIFLLVGLGQLVSGVLLHLIAHCCYQRNVVAALQQDDSEQPGLYAVAGYPAAAIFSHPQPLHVSPVPAVYYPTAAALHYPPPPQYVQQPPMGHIYQ